MTGVPAGWSRRAWGDIAVLNYGRALRDYRSQKLGVPVYGTNGRVGWTAAPALCPHAGVVIGRKGAYRGIHYAPEPFFVIDTAFWLQPVGDMDLRWTYYQLLTQDINAMDSGSAIPSTSRPDFYALPVLVPPLVEQRGIAATLGVLDDNIASNRRLIDICSTLLDATSSLLALDVEAVPLSYLTEPFREVFDPTSLGTEPFDHFSIPAFDAKGLPDRATGASVISAKLRVDRPAVLVSRLNPKTNRTWFAVPESGVTAGCSTEFLVLAPKAGVTLGSLWLAVRDEGFRSVLAQRVTGTSGSHQRVKPLDALATEVPDVRRLPAADVHGADELLWLMHQRRVESTRLAALRDALLPELLSGRIRVPEASEVVESALA